MNRHLAHCDFDLRSRCCESSWMRVVAASSVDLFGR